MTNCRYRFHNYESTLRKVWNSGITSKANQENVHQLLKLSEFNIMDDWKVTLFDTAGNRKKFRMR